MFKIRSGALETQSQAKAIIALHRISKIKPVTGVSGQFLVSNGGSGYAWGTVSAGLGIGQTSFFQPNHSITFNSQGNKPVLIITKDGDVEWRGKPSESAEALKRTFQFTVEDMKGVTKAARRRYYYRAVSNLAKKSQSMSANEFVDFVQKQAYTRERKVILDSLKGENVNS